MVLGIESSCDETAVALVERGTVLVNTVFSQIELHKAFGGVVPEIASRSHVEVLPGLLKKALAAAGKSWCDIATVAVTYGPGLASSLLVGVSAAKSLATYLEVPLLKVNHLEGHLYSVFMGTEAPAPADACPTLLLLVTGGNTMLVLVEGIGHYRMLGQTLDDAAGEALDKGAKLLGLPYPGGPEIERVAENGNPTAIDFPRGRVTAASHFPKELDPACCFSFSGLKTSLLYHVEKLSPHEVEKQKPDIAASYQEAVFDALIKRTEKGIQKTRPRSLSCVGGVAKNQRLRKMLEELGKRYHLPLYLAPLEYCTDNAAMIAALASAGRGVEVKDKPGLEVDPSLSLL